MKLVYHWASFIALDQIYILCRILEVIFNSECDGFEWIETENCFDFMKETTRLMEKRQKSKLDRLFADEREISR